MQYRVFRVPVGNPEETQEELNAFLRGNRIVHVRSDLVNDNAGSAYVFLVEYVQGNGKQKQKGGRVDYREVLPPEQFAVFARLRDARKRLSEEHGIPVYAVFTNEQLAAIARKPPANASDLAAVDGVGPAKTEKFGTAILGVLQENASE
jgi:superfamily II DNA helicase RecQ